MELLINNKKYTVEPHRDESLLSVLRNQLDLTGSKYGCGEGVEGKERRIVNLTDGSEKPLGDWNKMIIECVGNTIRVWVNGDLVNDGFDCTASKGQIAVQAEGAEVEFRKLQLTSLEK